MGDSITLLGNAGTDTQMLKCIKLTTEKSTTNSGMSSPGDALKWAYLAGLFDGEGSVSVADRARLRKGKRRNLVTYPYYMMWVRITNTSEELLRSLQSDFGGSLYVHYVTAPLTGTRDSSRWKPQWEWSFRNAAGSLFILNGMLPFLRYKKPEAELAIQFLSMLRPGSKARLTAPEADAREQIVLAIRALKGRRVCFGRKKKGLR